MKHPHAVRLEAIYSDFARGDIPSMLSHCADAVTFQVPGRSKLAGKYTKANFAQAFVAQLRELSGGSFKLEVHDVLASDRHGLVLTTESLTRAGKLVELRSVHVWRLEAGLPVAWYCYPRDLYQFDAAWA